MRPLFIIFSTLAACWLGLSTPVSASDPQTPPSQRPATTPDTPPRGEYVTREDVESGRVNLDSAWQGYRRRSPSRTDDDWGFRNPGNVGRMAQYYPPGNEFQNPGSPSQGARFDEGPAATQRSMQLQSQMVGIQRYNAIQSHIDRYGAPMMGWGWGFGFGGVR